MSTNHALDMAAVTIETTLEADSLWSLQNHLAAGCATSITIDVERYGTLAALENTLVAIRSAFEQSQINHETDIWFRTGSGDEREVSRDTINHLVGSQANLREYLTQRSYTLGRAD